MFLHVQDLAKKEGMIPSLEQIVNARDNIADFTQFCETFLSCVVGKTRYERSKTVTKITDIAKNSDEAFAILCFENSVAQWEQSVKHDDVDANCNPAKPRYTANPSNASKFGGWSSDGILRFNELAHSIVPKRRAETRELEMEFMRSMAESFDNRNNKKKKAKVSDDNIVCAFMEFDNGTFDSEESMNRDGSGDNDLDGQGNFNDDEVIEARNKTAV